MGPRDPGLGTAPGGALPPFPVLLRRAQRVYGRATWSALGDAGFDDLPRPGIWVLTGIGRMGWDLGGVAHGLGISKQAASQLVDVLVARGYCERRPHEGDRRRMEVQLTDRGTACTETIAAAIRDMEEAWCRRVGEGDLAVTRATLRALVALGAEGRL